MLFHVEMHVHVPQGIDSAQFERLKAEEKACAEELQRKGIWRHLWRVVGQYQNVSIFDVDSADELHQILTRLPLYPFMTINVTALCRHPSSVREDDH